LLVRGGGRVQGTAQALAMRKRLPHGPQPRVEVQGLSIDGGRFVERPCRLQCQRKIALRLGVSRSAGNQFAQYGQGFASAPALPEQITEIVQCVGKVRPYTQRFAIVLFCRLLVADGAIGIREVELRFDKTWLYAHRAFELRDGSLRVAHLQLGHAEIVVEPRIVGFDFERATDQGRARV